jgi:DeoR family transcriptional regulator, fructose operon transcriptional repressor
VVGLAEDSGVTAETIRKDLTVLERAGVLRRVHGGAIPVERLGFEPALAAHHAVMTAEKERIAKAPGPRCPRRARSSSTPAPPPAGSPRCCRPTAS